MKDLRRDLPHVLWLGGSTCAGKTTVARLLAAEHGLRLYACDDAFEEHRRRARPERHPGFCRIMDLSGPELCALPVDQQVDGLTGFYQDQMEMIVEDLLQIPDGGPVLAEGSGLLPELVAPLLTDHGKALWMIATPEFRRRRYRERAQRGSWVREAPEDVFRRWMERDDVLAARRSERASALGLAVLSVDGSLSIAETAGAVAHDLGLCRGE
jgi:shikimate kinase